MGTDLKFEDYQWTIKLSWDQGKSSSKSLDLHFVESCGWFFFNEGHQSFEHSCRENLSSRSSSWKLVSSFRPHEGLDDTISGPLVDAHWRSKATIVFIPLVAADQLFAIDVVHCIRHLESYTKTFCSRAPLKGFFRPFRFNEKCLRSVAGVTAPSTAKLRNQSRGPITAGLWLQNLWDSARKGIVVERFFSGQSAKFSWNNWFETSHRLDLMESLLKPPESYAEPLNHFAQDYAAQN